MKAKIKKYSPREELMNGITHGLGIAFGIIALILMIKKSLPPEESLKVASSTIYGSTIIFLFLASTLYHAISHEKVRALLKIIDHCAIYLLIAGTYTPFLLVSLKGSFALTMMIVIWSLAVLGVIFKIFFINRFKKISLVTYLGMGWLSVLLVHQLYQVIDLKALIYLGAGGITYSLGVIFYVANEKIPYNHAIWHLFVLAGCIGQFLGIYWYVF